MNSAKKFAILLTAIIFSAGCLQGAPEDNPANNQEETEQMPEPITGQQEDAAEELQDDEINYGIDETFGGDDVPAPPLPG